MHLKALDALYLAALFHLVSSLQLSLHLICPFYFRLQQLARTLTIHRIKSFAFYYYHNCTICHQRCIILDLFVKTLIYRNLSFPDEALSLH